jgi:hypothetical protein
MGFPIDRVDTPNERKKTFLSGIVLIQAIDQPSLSLPEGRSKHPIKGTSL